VPLQPHCCCCLSCLHCATTIRCATAHRATAALPPVVPQPPHYHPLCRSCMSCHRNHAARCHAAVRCCTPCCRRCQVSCRPSRGVACRAARYHVAAIALPPVAPRVMLRHTSCCRSCRVSLQSWCRPSRRRVVWPRSRCRPSRRVVWPRSRCRPSRRVVWLRSRCGVPCWCQVCCSSWGGHAAGVGTSLWYGGGWHWCGTYTQNLKWGQNKMKKATHRRC